MADKPTSTNQGLNLATVNTTHAGMTSAPTDVCKVPPKADPKPFMNTAPVDRNPVGMTSPRTVVDTKQIITIRARFGDLSDDAHEGTLGGISNGSYRGWAMVKDGSPDVKTEGVPPARHTDATIQNKGNTDGILRDKNQALDAINAEKGKLKRCTLVQVDFQQDGSPRKVTTAERGLYLEICEGSTITVTAHRRNMAAATTNQKGLAAPAPGCTVPAAGWEKTRFQVTRTGAFVSATTTRTGAVLNPVTGNNLIKNDTKTAIDVYPLTEDWVGKKPDKKAPDGKSPTPKPGEGADAQRRAFTDAKAVRGVAERSGQVNGVNAPPADPGRRAFLGLPPGPMGGAQTFATKAEFEAAKRGKMNEAYRARKADIAAKQDAFEKGARAEKQIITSAKIFLALWKSLTPSTITLNAAACTGAFVGQVKIYPADEFEFDLFELMETFCKPFETFLGGLKVLLNGISPATGGEWDMGLLNRSFFGHNKGTYEKPTIKIRWQYKELERDSAVQGGPKMNHVGLAFGFLLAVEKLVFVRADVSVSLFVIAGGPGFGGVAKKILEWCGIEFELGIAVELSVGVSGVAGRDEYLVWGMNECETSLLILASIYLIARAGSFGYAKAEFTFAFGLKLKDLSIGAGKNAPISVMVADQRFTFTFQATVQANVRGLRDPKKIPDAPHNLITPLTWPDVRKNIF